MRGMTVFYARFNEVLIAVGYDILIYMAMLEIYKTPVKMVKYQFFSLIINRIFLITINRIYPIMLLNRVIP